MAVDEAGDGVLLTVRDVRSGRHETVPATYLVAGDGARSAVRRSLSIQMLGPESVMHGVSVQFRAPLWSVLGPHRHGVYTVTRPEGGGVLVPAGQGDRWLFGVQLASSDGANATRPDALRRQMTLASGVPDLPVHIERVRPYSAGAQLAARFSVGRAFLVGDAAHRVTPRGGTGLNTAVGDGLDLGWKLAWVLRGWAPVALLDTYENERRPGISHNLARSTDPLGSRRPAISEMQVDLGGRIPHVWMEAHAASAERPLGRVSTSSTSAPRSSSPVPHPHGAGLSPPSPDPCPSPWPPCPRWQPVPWAFAPLAPRCSPDPTAYPSHSGRPPGTWPT